MYPSHLIRGAIAEQNKTVAEFAKDANVAPPTVTAVKKGSEQITLRSLKKVCAAAGLKVEINLVRIQPQSSE